MKTLMKTVLYILLWMLPLAGQAQWYERVARIAQQDSISTVRLPEMYHNYFGWKVAMDGNRAAVIAMSTGQPPKDPAACYVFEKGAESWALKQRLQVAMDSFPGFQLTGAMALSGDYLILGLNLLDDKHCAVIFHCDKASGLWQQEQVLYAPSERGQSFFAWAVAISQDYAMVSAADEDLGKKSNAGAIYVYKRKGSTWDRVQQIRASDPQADGFFGSKLALDKNHLLVGMPAGSSDTKGKSLLLNAGCAYIFHKDKRSGQWLQTAKLVAKDRAEKDLFGTSVAIQGNCAIVGAPNEDEDINGSNTLEGAGSVYIFSRQGWSRRWKQQQKLTAKDRAYSGGFGYDLATDGGQLLVGSYWRDSMAGCAYIFQKSGGQWIQRQKLVAEHPKARDMFGLSVDISGKQLIIGAYQKSTLPFSYDRPGERGEVYIFEER